MKIKDWIQNLKRRLFHHEVSKHKSEDEEYEEAKKLEATLQKKNSAQNNIVYRDISGD